MSPASRCLAPPARAATRRFKAAPPACLEPGSPFGPNLRAFALYLRFTQAISFERLSHLFSDLLGVDIDQVSIKAKTPEGLNMDHVAQCHAIALVERAQEPDELKSMSEVIESQRQLEDVVDDLLTTVHGVPKRRITPVYDTEDIT